MWGMRKLVWLPAVAAYQVLWAGPVMVGAVAAPRWTYRNLVLSWARAILGTAGATVELIGAERLPAGPVVIMANHVSYLDVPALFDKLPYELRFVAKKELQYVPFFGWATKALGHIFIDRGNSRQARASLDRGAAEIRAGASVVIFPEGTRSNDGRLLPFKKGGFVLAIKSGVPIVPVAICGVRDVLPKGATFAEPGVIRLRVQPPIDTRGYTLETKETLMADVRAAIDAGLAADDT